MSVPCLAKHHDTVSLLIQLLLQSSKVNLAVSDMSEKLYRPSWTVCI